MVSVTCSVAVAAILEQAREDGWRPGLEGLSWMHGRAAGRRGKRAEASGQELGAAGALLVRTYAYERLMAERTGGSSMALWYSPPVFAGFPD